jgi:hypothetical protein
VVNKLTMLIYPTASPQRCCCTHSNHRLLRNRVPETRVEIGAIVRAFKIGPS